MASRIRGIVDALRRELPAVTARLQREQTAITAITCDHRLTRGLEPITAAHRGAGARAPAWRRAQPPSRLAPFRRPAFKAAPGRRRFLRAFATPPSARPLRTWPEVGASIRRG